MTERKNHECFHFASAADAVAAIESAAAVIDQGHTY